MSRGTRDAGARLQMQRRLRGSLPLLRRRNHFQFIAEAVQVAEGWFEGQVTTTGLR